MIFRNCPNLTHNVGFLTNSSGDIGMSASISSILPSTIHAIAPLSVRAASHPWSTNGTLTRTSSPSNTRDTITYADGSVVTTIRDVTGRTVSSEETVASESRIINTDGSVVNRIMSPTGIVMFVKTVSAGNSNGAGGRGSQLDVVA